MKLQRKCLVELKDFMLDDNKFYHDISGKLLNIGDTVEVFYPTPEYGSFQTVVGTLTNMCTYRSVTVTNESGTYHVPYMFHEENGVFIGSYYYNEHDKTAYIKLLEMVEQINPEVVPNSETNQPQPKSSVTPSDSEEDPE